MDIWDASQREGSLQSPLALMKPIQIEVLQSPYTEGASQNPRSFVKTYTQMHILIIFLGMGASQSPIWKGLCRHICAHICTFQFFPTDMGLLHKASIERGLCKGHTDIGALQSPYREGLPKAAIPREFHKGIQRRLCTDPKGFICNVMYEYKFNLIL